MGIPRIVVFSGYNQRAVIAFLRKCTALQVPFSVIAIGPEDPIFQTVYRNQVVFVRESKSLSLASIITAIKIVRAEPGVESLWIFPSSEALNRFLLKHRDDLTDYGVEIPLCDESLYVELSDKITFAELCDRRGILVPKTLREPSPFCVAKPKNYMGRRGSVISPVLIRTEEKLNEFYSTFDVEDFFYQEYVEGCSYYLLYYFSKKNGDFLCFGQENLVQQPGGKSVILARYPKDDLTDITKRFANVFIDKGFFGLAMVEVRKRGKDYFMIECNPRPWGPMQFFVDSGIGFLEAYLEDFGFDGVPKGASLEDKTRSYFWSGGLGSHAFGELMYFGGYDKVQLNNNYRTLLKQDVYNRPDTFDIFKSERVCNE